MGIGQPFGGRDRPGQWRDADGRERSALPTQLYGRQHRRRWYLSLSFRDHDARRRIHHHWCRRNRYRHRSPRARKTTRGTEPSRCRTRAFATSGPVSDSESTPAESDPYLAAASSETVEPKLPRLAIYGVLAVCVLPTVLNLAGVDFGMTSKPPDHDAPPSVGPVRRRLRTRLARVVGCVHRHVHGGARPGSPCDSTRCRHPHHRAGALCRRLYGRRSHTRSDSSHRSGRVRGKSHPVHVGPVSIVQCRHLVAGGADGAVPTPPKLATGLAKNHSRHRHRFSGSSHTR